MDVSIKLAELALDLYNVNHKNNVYTATKRLFLDALACAMAGHDAPGIDIIKEQIYEWGGKEEASVFFENRTLPAPNAAFINSAVLHAVDYDDVHLSANTHVMSTVFPVAFAIGEMMNSTGVQVLNAVISGVEISCRIAKVFMKYRSNNGFLTTTITGGFGAAVTAALLMSADVEEIVNTMGIYYAQTSGNRQALLDLSLTKRIQPAFAVKSAIWSAMLAKKGFTGANKIFKGFFGFFHLYSDGGIPEDSEFFTQSDFMEIEEIDIKRFPTCGCHHSSILAAIELSEKHMLKYEEIDYFEIHMPKSGADLVGHPFVMDENPQVAAQFCAPYGVAHALLKGHVHIKDLTNEQIRKNTQTVALAQKAKIMVYENNNSQIVKVKLKNGNMLISEWDEDYFVPRGEGYENIIAKFKECTEFSGLPQISHTEKIIDYVKRFEELTNIADFIKEYLN